MSQEVVVLNAIGCTNHSQMRELVSVPEDLL